MQFKINNTLSSEFDRLQYILHWQSGHWPDVLDFLFSMEWFSHGEKPCVVRSGYLQEGFAPIQVHKCSHRAILVRCSSQIDSPLIRREEWCLWKWQRWSVRSCTLLDEGTEVLSQETMHRCSQLSEQLHRLYGDETGVEWPQRRRENLEAWIWRQPAGDFESPSLQLVLVGAAK